MRHDTIHLIDVREDDAPTIVRRTTPPCVVIQWGELHLTMTPGDAIMIGDALTRAGESFVLGGAA